MRANILLNIDTEKAQFKNGITTYIKVCILKDLGEPLVCKEVYSELSIRQFYLTIEFDETLKEVLTDDEAIEYAVRECLYTNHSSAEQFIPYISVV